MLYIKSTEIKYSNMHTAAGNIDPSLIQRRQVSAHPGH